MPDNSPHLTSDDTAIVAAQAGIRGNLETRARACFDAALARPSTIAVEAVSRALMALHHQWVAGMERDIADLRHDIGQYQERQAQMLTDCQGDCQGGRPRYRMPEWEIDEMATEAGAIFRARLGFGRNPAPVMPAVSEGRPLPCVPRHPVGERG